MFPFSRFLSATISTNHLHENKNKKTVVNIKWNCKSSVSLLQIIFCTQLFFLRRSPKYCKLSCYINFDMVAEGFLFHETKMTLKNWKSFYDGDTDTPKVAETHNWLSMVVCVLSKPDWGDSTRWHLDTLKMEKRVFTKYRQPL